MRKDWGFLVYFGVRGSHIHETVIFDVIYCILMRHTIARRVSWVTGRLCVFLTCTVLVKLTFLTH